MALTGIEKTKWIRLKKEIVKRPFLAYRIGLTSEEIESYFSGGIPTKERIEEIDKLLLQVRQKNVERLRTTLTLVVGNRGSVQFAEKIDSDGMTIKYIIDKKTTKIPGHDLISKIENHLSYITEFEVSIENQSDEKLFVPNKIDKIKISTHNIVDKLNGLSPFYEDLKIADKKLKRGFTTIKPEQWRINNLQRTLDSSISELEKIRLEVETIIKEYID
jgi:hypothetical protein